MTAPDRGAGQVVRLLAGLVFGAVLAWLLFRGTDWTAVRAALANAGHGWIALAFTCAFAGQFLRAKRLAVILADHPAVTYREAFYATQLGMLMNVVLPMRLGEGVRILVLVRRCGIDVATAVSSAVVDRVTDMIALFVIAGTAVVASPSFAGIRIAPGMLQNAEPIVVPAAALTGILGGLSVMLTVTLVGLLLVRTKPAAVMTIARAVTSPAPRAAAAPVMAVVESFTRTAGQLASARGIASATALSLAAWGCGLGSLYGLLTAFGLNVPWPAPFLILSLIAAFVAAPLTPGLVGQYHVPVLAGVLLVDPDVAASTAKAATILGYFLFLVPIAVLGVAALVGTRLGAKDLVSAAGADVAD